MRSRNPPWAAGLAAVLLAGEAHAQPAPPPPPSVQAEADRARDALLAQQSSAMAVLGTWAVGSMGVGAGMWARGRTPMVRAAGVQQLAWGAIDGAIAALSYRGVRSDRGERKPLAHWERERSKLRTVLAVNVALDVAYLIAGVALARLGQRESVRGAGAGIVPQGAFLLTFDTAFLLSL